MRSDRAVTHGDAVQGWQLETARDEAQDRRRVHRGVVDEAAARIGRDDDGGDTRARSPAVALGRRHMVPQAAIFVIGHDDKHMRPLRALLQMRDHVGDMSIACLDVGIAGMLIEVALRLVESDLRQRAGVDRLDELYASEAAVAKMLGAGCRARCEIGIIVQRLVVILEVRHRSLVAVGEHIEPGPAVPGPADVLET